MISTSGNLGCLIVNCPPLFRGFKLAEMAAYILLESPLYGWVDLPHVDLINFRLERPRIDRFFKSRSGRASDEVARDQLVSLQGFSFSFRAKNEEWRDLQLVSHITFGSTSIGGFHVTQVSLITTQVKNKIACHLIN